MGPAGRRAADRRRTPMAGLAALGGSAGFIGQVADDQLGEVFAHDIRALGVDFGTPPRTGGAADRALPDRRHARWAADDEHLPRRLPVPARRRARAERSRAAILYLEGYLWDPEEPRAAMRGRSSRPRGGAEGRASRCPTSSASAPRRRFPRADRRGLIDILFANENEILALAASTNSRPRSTRSHGKVPLLVVTRGEQGAMAMEGRRARRAARRANRAGWWIPPGPATCSPPASSGPGAGPGLEELLKLGAICAAEVISHYGARPEADLKALVEQELGPA